MGFAYCSMFEGLPLIFELDLATGSCSLNWSNILVGTSAKMEMADVNSTTSTSSTVSSSNYAALAFCFCCCSRFWEKTRVWPFSKVSSSTCSSADDIQFFSSGLRLVAIVGLPSDRKKSMLFPLHEKTGLCHYFCNRSFVHVSIVDRYWNSVEYGWRHFGHRFWRHWDR